jgi:glyoxylase-like metal-dependent hydrolase (beta-lactamase superfamily II)
MNVKRALSFVVFLALATSSAGAGEIQGLELHVQRLDPATIRLWIGDSISSTAIVAFATEKGIVVVDTFGIPAIDTELRAAIARELGRSDFRVLINTHEHRDHTGGNSVYSDCTIVGHERIAEGLAQMADHRDRLLQWYPDRIAELEAELGSLDEDSPEAARLREDLIINRLNYEEVKADRKPVPPTVTFSERMALDMGDTTFELSYIGGMHTASDAAVFVPERGILMTGDTMADVWLTDTPGCLASFSVRSGIHHDFPLWLANWDRLLARRDEITVLLPGHWNGELSIEGAEARVEYVRAIWQGVSEASAEGKTLEETQAAYRLDARFPELVDSPGFEQTRHWGSISEIWAVASGQESAARAIWEALDQGLGEEAVAAIVADRDSSSPSYFFIENEFNAYGYVFLQQDKVDQAITVFRINVELFPKSWNVYDSLGEALLRAGKTDEAVAMYEKSMALNPDNDNGREVLARIGDSA